MALLQTVREQFRRYCPQLEGLLFGLSLLGTLLVMHLYVQQTRGFTEGCFGFGAVDAASIFDCAAVTTGPGSELFGVSNLVWGFAFYGAVAICTVGIFLVRPHLREWVQGLRTTLLTGGVLYSGVLTYLQLGALEGICPLCLASTVIVTLLFGTQISVLAFSSSSVDTPMSARLVKRQVALFVYLIATAVVLAGADLVSFAETQAPSEARPAVSASGGEDECQLDTSKEPVGDQGGSLINFQDITKGSAESGVTVIEFFDPNCPHCKDFHQIMKTIVEAHSDEVRFVYKPFALRRSSLPEIQALYVAAQSGKFTEMLEGQYARQNQSGISMSDVRSIASEIGMDPDAVNNKVEQNEYREQVLEIRKRAVKIGVDSTPTVLVNGHFVQTRSEECMSTFIEQAKEGTLGETASR